MRLQSAKLSFFAKALFSTLVIIFIFWTCFPNTKVWYPKIIFSTGDSRSIAQVAVDGDKLLVYGVEHRSISFRKDKGAKVSIYIRSGSGWIRQTQIPTDVARHAGFIKHMDISNNTVVLANTPRSHHSNDSARNSSVSVFIQTGSQWTEQAKLLIPSDTSHRFDVENSVAIDGNTIVVSDYNAVHIFERNPATKVWAYQTKLSIPKTADLNIGVNRRDYTVSFGGKVAISGNTLITSGHIQDRFRVNAPPRIFVFERNPTTNTWAYHTALVPGQSGSYGCGGDIAIDSDTIMAGCPSETIWHSDIMGPIGAAYIFTRDVKTDTWSKPDRIEPHGVYRGEFWEWTRFFEAYGFGREISVHGDVAVISAFNEESRMFSSDDTAAYLYRRDRNGLWQQQAKLLADPKVKGQGTSRATHHGVVSQRYVLIGDNSVPSEKGRAPRSGFYAFDLESSPP